MIKTYSVVALLLVVNCFAAGDATLALLLDQLNSNDAVLRLAAAKTLAMTNIGDGDPKTAANALSKSVVNDRDSDVRYYCAIALGVLFVNDSNRNTNTFQDDVNRLIKDIHDSVPRTRIAVLLALAAAPRLDGNAVDQLVTLLADSDASVRLDALRALSKNMHVSLATEHSIVLTLTSDRDPAVRGAAAAALTGLSPIQTETIAALSSSLRDQSSYLRQEALRAIGQMGPQAVAALAALQQIAQDSNQDYFLRQLAQFAINAVQQPQH